MNLEGVTLTEESLERVRRMTVVSYNAHINRLHLLKELDAALWDALNGGVSKEGLGEEFVKELLDKLNLVTELLKEAGKGPY